jgi:hypothetical protein
VATGSQFAPDRRVIAVQTQNYAGRLDKIGRLARNGSLVQTQGKLPAIVAFVTYITNLLVGFVAVHIVPHLVGIEEIKFYKRG